jgi:hypothetical protein
MVLKFKTLDENVQEIHLTPEGEALLENLINPTEIGETKKSLFNVMHGLAILSVTALSVQHVLEPVDRVFITRDVVQSVYVIGQIYDILCNIK